MEGAREPDGVLLEAAEARCAWCGHVPVRPEDLVVHVRRAGHGLFEFRCPRCDRVNIRRLSREDVRVLRAVGLRPAAGDGPFELTERRSGPPIDWDDVIELGLALERDAA